jgi:hypothetical protein
MKIAGSKLQFPQKNVNNSNGLSFVNKIWESVNNMVFIELIWINVKFSLTYVQNLQLNILESHLKGIIF